MTFDKFTTILETPISIGTVDFQSLNSERKRKWMSPEKVIGSFTIKDTKIDIQKAYMNEDEQLDYLMVFDDVIIGRYVARKLKGGVVTDSTQTSKFIKGFSVLFEFYIQFLLKKYDFVISDDMLSDSAFGFYHKNFNKFIDHGYKMSAVKLQLWENKEWMIRDEIPLKNKDDLYSYFGTIFNADAQLYRYKISK